MKAINIKRIKNVYKFIFTLQNASCYTESKIRYRESQYKSNFYHWPWAVDLIGSRRCRYRRRYQLVISKSCTNKDFSGSTRLYEHIFRRSESTVNGISQFTLLASTKKGNRPSFIKAAPAVEAEQMYEKFVKKLTEMSQSLIQTGSFGADMQVELINDGPVTIIIDSKNKE